MNEKKTKNKKIGMQCTSRQAHTIIIYTILTIHTRELTLHTATIQAKSQHFEISQ